MKILLALVLLLLSVVPATAHWSTVSPVPVYDYTTDRWNPAVSFQVADYNAKRPAGSRSLIYYNMNVKPCDQLTFANTAPGVYVCNVPLIGDGPGCPGCATTGLVWSRDRTKVMASYIKIEDTTEAFNTGPYALVCHEFVHAVGLVADGDTSYSQGSCMRGFRQGFSSWDVSYMAGALAGTHGWVNPPSPTPGPVCCNKKHTDHHKKHRR